MLNGLHLYRAFLTRGHSKRFTICLTDACADDDISELRLMTHSISHALSRWQSSNDMILLFSQMIIYKKASVEISQAAFE